MPTVSNGLYKWLVGRGATLEDFADRLNHFWTFGLLLLFACIVSWKQGYEKPIHCWMPAQFTNARDRYTEQACWNSYFITYSKDIIMRKQGIYQEGYALVTSDPDYENDQMSTTIYQWISVILCFQALLFKLPNLVMYISHSYSGMAFEKVAGLTKGYQNMNIQDRDAISRQIARYMYNWCLQFKNFIPCRLLTLIWLVVKGLYLVNVIVQMSLVDSLLKTTNPPFDDSTSYGDVIGGNLLHKNAALWTFSPAFPRHVICVLKKIEIHKFVFYHFECDLTNNNFNEYIFMFLWVWILIVALVTCLSLVVWTISVTMPLFRRRYIKRLMAIADNVDATMIPRDDLERFCNMIGEDGVMALKLMSANSSDILVANVVSDMYNMHIATCEAQKTGQILALP